MGEQFRCRSADTSVPSDQDLNCSLFDLIGYFRPKYDQCRSRSDGMDVPADLDLHWSHTRKNVYTVKFLLNAPSGFTFSKTGALIRRCLSLNPVISIFWYAVFIHVYSISI
jgi:hypothetical protein